MTCDATWMVASFHSTSSPFIQILPVPENAISAPQKDLNAIGELVIWRRGEFANSPIHEFTNYCISPQKGHRSDRACSGLRQCQQNRGGGASRALSRNWMSSATVGVSASAGPAAGRGLR